MTRRHPLKSAPRQFPRISAAAKRLGKKSRLNIRTNRDKIPDLGKPEPHEREAAAFWFRRITTTLLVGNGGGVIALGGFLSNAEDRAAAAVVAYPALSYFLSGVLITVLSYMGSMLWNGLRIEAYAAHYAAIIDRQRAEERSKVQKKLSFLEELRKPTPSLAKGEGWFTFGFAILGLIQFASLAGAAILFYAGASTVIGGTRDMLCSSTPDNGLCQLEPSVLFPSQAAASARKTEPAPDDYLTIARYPVSASAEFEKLDTRSLWPTRVVTYRQGVERYTGGFVEMIVRMTDNDAERECFFNLSNYSNNGTSPYRVNPTLSRFFTHASRPHREITVDPVSLTMVMIFEGTDSKTHSWQANFDVQSGELRKSEQRYDIAGRLLPSDHAEGGAYVIIPSEGEVDSTCLATAVVYGFEMGRVTRRGTRAAD